jgi:hypothetical protein
MAAVSVSGAKRSASESVGDARHSVEGVIAKVAIGAVGDGRDIPIGDGQIENAIADLISSSSDFRSAVNTDASIVALNDRWNNYVVESCCRFDIRNKWENRFISRRDAFGDDVIGFDGVHR